MLRTVRSLVMLAALVAAPLAASAATWEIDPVHSSIEFSIRHLMISNVRGQFGKFSATVTGDPSDPASAKLEATIDASSIDTRNEKRDGHLKSADFLDVEKFPTITFKSKKVERAGEGKWKVTGDLTLHGVTKEAVLEVQGPMPPIKDPMGNVKSGASATTTIDRKDFGIVWNKAMDGGGVMVGDDVAITVNVEAVKKGD
jgi:polyisoprenoid-binding protein YceI